MMKNLNRWERRSIEEASLLNPAFICVLIINFLKEYLKKQPNGAPITIIIIAITAVLHYDTRQRLPNSTRRIFYDWIENNEDILIEFSDLSKNILPYIKEAIMFGILTKTLKIGSGHNIILGDECISSTDIISKNSIELETIIKKINFTGRWFSKNIFENTFLAAWGIKP